MDSKILIRNEIDAYVDAISEAAVAAFKTLAASNQTEQFIVEALRSSKTLSVSMVAEAEGRVVGHIAFSPVIMSDGTKDWCDLGPVSVHPAFE
jgi:putative acetyltransferase